MVLVQHVNIIRDLGTTVLQYHCCWQYLLLQNRYALVLSTMDVQL